MLRLYIQSLQKDTSVTSPDASWARCSFQPTGWRKMRNDRVFSSQLFSCIIGMLKTSMHVRKLPGRCLGWAQCCSSLALFLLGLGYSPASRGGQLGPLAPPGSRSRLGGSGMVQAAGLVCCLAPG